MNIGHEIDDEFETLIEEYKGRLQTIRDILLIIDQIYGTHLGPKITVLLPDLETLLRYYKAVPENQESASVANSFIKKFEDCLNDIYTTFGADTMLSEKFGLLLGFPYALYMFIQNNLNGTSYSSGDIKVIERIIDEIILPCYRKLYNKHRTSN